MSDTLIVNARLVNEGREFDGDLRISRGRIAQIGSEPCGAGWRIRWSMPPVGDCSRA
jgi:dihydroorotase